MEENTGRHSSGSAKRQWETPRIEHLGDVASVVLGGGGKVTILTGDPGEPRKVPALDK